MGFLRRFVCGCGTKALPVQSPTYESCVPSAFSPVQQDKDTWEQDKDTWAPGRWTCSSSPVADKVKKIASKQIDGTSEASTELPGAIAESPSSSINAVLSLHTGIQRELPSQMTRAHTAPPQARPRVTYFSDSRAGTSSNRRKAPPPLFMVGENRSPVEAQIEVIQKPWSH